VSDRGDDLAWAGRRIEELYARALRWRTRAEAAEAELTKLRADFASLEADAAACVRALEEGERVRTGHRTHDALAPLAAMDLERAVATMRDRGREDWWKR
jgi:hypothetical protein